MSASEHIETRIADLLLGDVSDGEREALEAHVAGCARCNHEMMQAADAFAALALALPTEAPPASLRQRILDDAKPHRLASMIDKLASLYDITRARARTLLERIDEPDGWVEGPVPHSSLFFVEGCGPKTAGAMCTFVKMGANVDWPPHRHLGREYMLVLEGGFRQPDGVEVHPGDLQIMEEGTAHQFTIFGDEPCLAAALIFNGIAFDGLADPKTK